MPKSKKPPHYAVIDVETTRIEHGQRPETLFWGYADSNGYKRFETSVELIEYLEHEETRHLLHHTNYDIIQLLVDGIRDLRFVRSHNGKFIVTSILDKHIALNSYAIFPVKLEKIFKCFGYEKSSLDDLAKRNYDDCVFGLECILRMDALFESLIGQSPLRRHTIAATTFAAAEYEAGKLQKDIRFIEAYRGGRVDVFDTNFYENVKRFDINSSYPYSFCDSPPVGKLLFCEIRSKCHYGPCYDSDTMDRLLFPAGTFRTYIYQDVLDRYILPNWEKSDIRILSSTSIDLSWLGRVQPLITKLYNLKLGKSKTSAEYLLAKLGLNAMYGRIGLRGMSERCQLLKGWPDKDCTACQLPGGWDDWLVWYSIQTEPRSNFPLAAYITDNARGRLYEGLIQNNGIYGDTDSIDTNEKGPDTGNRLGQWKFEGVRVFQANNLKDYYEADSKSGDWYSPTLDRWQLTRKVKGGETSTQWTLKKFAQGKVVETVQKTFSKLLRKRALMKDGTTEPLRVGI